MSQPPTDLELISQAISDLDTLLREELIALQYEIMGARDVLSDELASWCDEINRRLTALEHRQCD